MRLGRIRAAEGARVLAKRVGRARVTLDEQPGPDRIGHRLQARPAHAAAGAARRKRSFPASLTMCGRYELHAMPAAIALVADPPTTMP